jgi:hypothetical protein
MDIGSEDIKILREELKKTAQERDYYYQQFFKEIEKSQRLQLELELSEERFVQSKAFKKLMQQAKTLHRQMETLRERNNELQRQNDEALDIKQREIQQVKAKEEEIRQQLAAESEALKSGFILLKKERDEALFILEDKNRKEQGLITELNNIKTLVEDMEREKNLFKKQILDLKKQNKELNRKSEEDLRKIVELQDQLQKGLNELSDYQIKLAKQAPEPTLSDSLQDRLLKYRNEIFELRKMHKSSQNEVSIRDERISKLERELANKRSVRYILGK